MFDFTGASVALLSMGPVKFQDMIIKLPISRIRDKIIW